MIKTLTTIGNFIKKHSDSNYSISKLSSYLLNCGTFYLKFWEFESLFSIGIYNDKEECIALINFKSDEVNENDYLEFMKVYRRLNE